MMSAARTALKPDKNLPSIKEALRYSIPSLLIGVKRRRKNLTVFKAVINKEREAIRYQQYIISQIDPTHPDVKVLKENIRKRRLNIKTFHQAIVDEKSLISKEKNMIKIILANRTKR